MVDDPSLCPASSKCAHLAGDSSAVISLALYLSHEILLLLGVSLVEGMIHRARDPATPHGKAAVNEGQKGNEFLTPSLSLRFLV